MREDQDGPVEQPEPEPTQNWWEGPPPPGYTGTWPPPLPPGASYGPNFGQIIYGPGGNPDADTTPHPEDWPHPPAPQPGPNAPPAPTPAPAPPGGTLPGGLLDPFDEQFHPPPNSNALGNLPPVPIFNFQAPPRFEAPSWEEVMKDPGFIFRNKLGNEAITNSAAAQGMARHGNTLKDFINYNQDSASGEYGNVYNRRASEHDKLYGEMFGEATAKFAPEMEGWRFLSSATQRQSELDWDRAWQMFNKDFDIFKWNKQWPYSVLSDQQHLGLSAN